MRTLVSTTLPGDGVAVITMSNPDIDNFGSWAAIEQLSAALIEAREGGARVSVLASDVQGHWLEHAWLPDLRATIEDQPTTGEGSSWFSCLEELNRTSVVTIAAISGDTSGGGCELGWACDLRIAEAGVRFGQPEVQIGVGTGIGGTNRLRHIIGRTATAEMVLLGAPMTAERLYELGGVNRVVPTGCSLDLAVDWASRMASMSPAALAGMKQMLTEGDDLLRIAESVMNDQHIFWTFSATPDAQERISTIQARFDDGDGPRTVYGEPLD
ncbi:MAG: enoyl-CoA hydratase/isomerase family protein [Acidimicrobiia bacterium]|nr:enoyl-CoA hydratase/isomerase family protein [Acidimicrobiia bacterium]